MLADEPTSALDVTVQAQVVKRMKELRDQFGTAMLVVTHNMGVVAQLCDLVGVMYGGRIVEWGTVQEVLEQPSHPYTCALIEAIPDMSGADPKGIPGVPPDFSEPLPGCDFAPRCPCASSACQECVPSSTWSPKPVGFYAPIGKGREEMALLEVKGLYKVFTKDKVKVAAVNQVDLTLKEGECLGLVGESGCGKSTTAQLIARLLKEDRGEIWFQGEDLRKPANLKSCGGIFR